MQTARATAAVHKFKMFKSTRVGRYSVDRLLSARRAIAVAAAVLSSAVIAMGYYFYYNTSWEASRQL